MASIRGDVGGTASREAEESVSTHHGVGLGVGRRTARVHQRYVEDDEEVTIDMGTGKEHEYAPDDGPESPGKGQVGAPSSEMCVGNSGVQRAFVRAARVFSTPADLLTAGYLTLTLPLYAWEWLSNPQIAESGGRMGWVLFHVAVLAVSVWVGGGGLDTMVGGGSKGFQSQSQSQSQSHAHVHTHPTTTTTTTTTADGEKAGHVDAVAAAVGDGDADADADVEANSNAATKGETQGRRPVVGRLVRFVGDVYAVVVFGLLYSEISVLNQTVWHGRMFDEEVQLVEESMFGQQLAVTLRTWPVLRWKVVGEYLHLCYFALYPIIASLPLLVRLTRPRAQALVAIGTLVLCFYTGFACYILLPVKGPYWNFSPPDPGQVGFVFSHITHGIVSKGSSMGTAFPSSHVGISVTCMLLAARFHRPLALAYLAVVPGLCLATVYGGFHYGIDALAGLAMAYAVVTCGLPFVHYILYLQLHRAHNPLTFAAFRRASMASHALPDSQLHLPTHNNALHIPLQIPRIVDITNDAISDFAAITTKAAMVAEQHALSVSPLLLPVHSHLETPAHTDLARDRSASLDSRSVSS